MKAPSNDICRKIYGGYVDIVWCGPRKPSRWRVMLRDKLVGYAPTKRRAKKMVHFPMYYMRDLEN